MAYDPMGDARHQVARTEHLLKCSRFRDLSEIKELERWTELHASDAAYDDEDLDPEVHRAFRESIRLLESEAQRLRTTYFPAQN